MDQVQSAIHSGVQSENGKKFLGAAKDVLGASTAETVDAPMSYNGIAFPVVPAGVRTTIINVPFPLESPRDSLSITIIEQLEVAAIVLAAFLIWLLPKAIVNAGFCCRCLRRWLSRNMQLYFAVMLCINVGMVSLVIYLVPHISANSLFMGFVRMFENVVATVLGGLDTALIVAAAILCFLLRKKFLILLGYEEQAQIVRWSLRDFLTCFTMHRFSVIELSLWKFESLTGGFGTRTLYSHVQCGYNETTHTRPSDCSGSTLLVRERLQLNYDDEDETTKLTIIVKEQELLGTTVAEIAPAMGALMGAGLGNLIPFSDAMQGTALGLVAGTGAANSLGREVARLDLSSTMINRILSKSKTSWRFMRTLSTVPEVRWSEDNFVRVDLVPQGCVWMRIAWA